MSVWRYLLRFSIRNLTRNRLMNIVAISTTALALLITSGVLLVHQNVASIINRMKERTPVILYLEDDFDQNQVSQLQSNLITREDVVDISYRTREEAWEEFQRSLQLEGNLLEGLSRNPLPASIHLNFEPGALSRVDEIAAELRELDGVESVDYGREIIDRLSGLGRVFQMVLGIIGVVICFVAIFIIFNTIRLSVVSCATEIGILKLVGATHLFVGFPFVVGGIVYGFLGSLFGQLLLWVIYWIVESRLAGLGFIPLEFHFLSSFWIFLIIVLGTLLGVIGSVTAVRRAVDTM